MIVGTILHGFQCKSGEKTPKFSPSACLQFAHEIHLPANTKVHCWVVVLERLVAKWISLLGNSPFEQLKAATEKPVKQQWDHLCPNISFSILSHSFKLDQMQFQSDDEVHWDAQVLDVELPEADEQGEEEETKS